MILKSFSKEKAQSQQENKAKRKQGQDKISQLENLPQLFTK